MNTYIYVFLSQMYIQASILNDACTCMLGILAVGEDNFLRCTVQGGVTPVDSIVTAATALSQRLTVKPVE